MNLTLKSEVKKPIKESQYYWLTKRDKVNRGFVEQIILLMKRRKKGIYKISPVFTLEIK
jgi:hypothetical protein